MPHPATRRKREELLNHAANFDAADELISRDYGSYEPTSGEKRGIEGDKKFAAYHHAFTELQNTIEDMVAEGLRVRYSATLGE